jgi:hypothetical protein
MEQTDYGLKHVMGFVMAFLKALRLDTAAAVSSPCHDGSAVHATCCPAFLGALLVYAWASSSVLHTEVPTNPGTSND